MPKGGQRVSREQRRAQFERRLARLRPSALAEFSRPRYEQLLLRVKSAKRCKDSGTRSARTLEMYKVAVVEGVERLTTATGKGQRKLVYLPSDELFDVISAAHGASHNGRDAVLDSLSRKYQNVTKEAVELYLELCCGWPPARHPRRSSRQGSVDDKTEVAASSSAEGRTRRGVSTRRSRGDADDVNIDKITKKRNKEEADDLNDEVNLKKSKVAKNEDVKIGKIMKKRGKEETDDLKDEMNLKKRRVVKGMGRVVKERDKEEAEEGSAEKAVKGGKLVMRRRKVEESRERREPVPTPYRLDVIQPPTEFGEQKGFILVLREIPTNFVQLRYLESLTPQWLAEVVSPIFSTFGTPSQLMTSTVDCLEAVLSKMQLEGIPLEMGEGPPPVSRLEHLLLLWATEHGLNSRTNGLKLAQYIANLLPEIEGEPSPFELKFGRKGKLDVSTLPDFLQEELLKNLSPANAAPPPPEVPDMDVSHLLEVVYHSDED